MAEISVTRIDDETFRVEVGNGSSTVHTVTVTADDAARLAPGCDVETLVAESFRFLLEREPNESILRRFVLPVISRYFPEYDQEITRRLS
jgi:hypothetical protein